MVSGRLDGEPGAAADGGAEGDEQLGEDRDGVGLCVRRDPGDDLAQQLVVDRRGGRRRPPRRRRQRGQAAEGPPAAGLAARVSFGGDLGDRSARGGLVHDRLL
jgi:hypothetical protein